VTPAARGGWVHARVRVRTAFFSRVTAGASASDTAADPTFFTSFSFGFSAAAAALRGGCAIALI
jgi:hypothetical protein